MCPYLPFNQTFIELLSTLRKYVTQISHLRSKVILASILLSSGTESIYHAMSLLRWFLGLECNYCNPCLLCIFAYCSYRERVTLATCKRRLKDHIHVKIVLMEPICSIYLTLSLYQGFHWLSMTSFVFLCCKIHQNSIWSI